MTPDIHAMTPDLYEVELRNRHLGPLRWFLAGDPEGLKPFERDPGDADVRAERALILAAAGVAILRRFRTYTRAQIVRFVGDLRMSLGEHADDVDAVIAEDLIRTVVGDLPARELVRTRRDPQKTVLAHIFVLERLRDEDIPSEDGMDDFLDDTMDRARRMLADQRALLTGQRALLT